MSPVSVVHHRSERDKAGIFNLRHQHKCATTENPFNTQTWKGYPMAYTRVTLLLASSAGRRAALRSELPVSLDHRGRSAFEPPGSGGATLEPEAARVQQERSSSSHEQRQGSRGRPPPTSGGRVLAPPGTAAEGVRVLRYAAANRRSRNLRNRRGLL